MRPELIPGCAREAEPFERGFLARRGIVLRVPLLQIGLPHRARIAARVVARAFVLPRLWRVRYRLLGHFQNPLRALEPVHLRSAATEIQAQIDRRSSVVKERRVDIRHVAAIREAQNGTERHGLLWRLVAVEHKVHPAYQMYEEIAGESRAVFAPATPACKDIWIEGPLRHLPLPGIPIQIAGRKIGRRRILPGPRGVVPAQ